MKTIEKLKNIISQLFVQLFINSIEIYNEKLLFSVVE